MAKINQTIAVLGIQLQEDGTLDRSVCNSWNPVQSPGSQLVDGIRVESRDVVVDKATGLWVRFYVPGSRHDDKLPVVIFFHGGGLVMGSAASCREHKMCTGISARANVVIMSVNYRLAPEHPLPAAFDDAMTVLEWLVSSPEEEDEDRIWALGRGDVSGCLVLMGESSGATIAHHAGLAGVRGNIPVHGICFCVPGVIGSKVTESEARFGEDIRGCFPIVNKMYLPPDGDMDHPYVSYHEKQDDAGMLPGKILVALAKEDFLRDRQLVYVDTLRKAGKDVMLLDYDGLGHNLSFPEIQDERRETAYDAFKEFISKCAESM